MDVVNVALENSPLANLINSSDPIDVFSYGSENTNSFSRQRAEVVATGAALGQEVSVDVPKYGILAKVICRVDFTQATAVGRTGAQGLNMLDYIELASSNRVIARQTQKGLAGMLSEMSADREDQVSKALNTSTTAAANKLAFIPFYFALSADGRGDHGENNYRGCFDTRFVENLTCRVKLQSASAWDATGTGTLNEVRFIFHYVVPAESVYRSLEEKNYSSGPLNILSLTEFAESSKAITNGDTSETISLNSNGLIKKMYIQIEGAAQVAADGTADRRVSHAITKLTLNGSGREIISFYGPELQFLDNVNKSGDTAASYCLDFSAMPNKSGFSGGLSLREIANPELSLTFADPGEAATLTVVHKQYELLSINPANGRISVSLSS
jgi:hypothetical protein